MRKHSLLWIVLPLILTGCSSTMNTLSVTLVPDPTPPVFTNESDIRELQIDIANAKILLARWKMKAANDRLITGEITPEERDSIVLPILSALRELGLSEDTDYLPD